MSSMLEVSSYTVERVFRHFENLWRYSQYLAGWITFIVSCVCCQCCSHVPTLKPRRGDNHSIDGFEYKTHIFEEEEIKPDEDLVIDVDHQAGDSLPESHSPPANSRQGQIGDGSDTPSLKSSLSQKYRRGAAALVEECCVHAAGRGPRGKKHGQGCSKSVSFSKAEPYVYYA